jgi:hypothetical protein
MGIDGESLLGASRPAVVHNAADREFLVVWEGGGSPVADQTGSIVNSPGTGANGADESVLQSVSLGMNTLGLSLFIPSFRLADDFTVTDPDGLALEEIVLFAYQTGSTLDSTITEFNLRIWDRPPDVPGAKVLFGNLSGDGDNPWQHIAPDHDEHGGCRRVPRAGNLLVRLPG